MRSIQIEKAVAKKKHPIEALIEEGEHQQLDFKFEVNDSKKIARTLSAFANTDGGRLLIGVKDNGVITGIRSEEEYYMIEAASKMYIRPEVTFTATRWDIHGKTVLEIYIAPSSHKPYTALYKDDQYKAYIRVADENMLANEILLLAWKKQLDEKGILLRISKPVEKLLHYLEEHPHINLNRFCRIAHINYYTAKNILSDLMATHTLRYKVIDKHIVYERIG
ncbi:ATP-dependent DNA helicase [Bacteroidia bacterium]|nr:ATP-dependent DNA helicase [Bacteroidia bacterium]